MLIVTGAYVLQRTVGSGTPSVIHTVAVLPFDVTVNEYGWTGE